MKAAALLIVLLAGCERAPTPSKPVTDPPLPVRERPSATKTLTDSGSVDYWHDSETGCEYIMLHRGGITPRMKPDGKQLCREVQR